MVLFNKVLAQAVPSDQTFEQKFSESCIFASYFILERDGLPAFSALVVYFTQGKCDGCCDSEEAVCSRQPCQLFGAGKVDDVFLLIQCGSSHGAEALRLKCGNLCGQHLRSLEWTCVFRSGHPRWFGAFGWYEFLAISTLPLLTNIPSDLVGSFFANCTRDALYKYKFSAMLGMLEMARWISRSAPTTSSKLVIKMGRSFTTTIRMALLSMAASLQSFCKVYMWLLVWILWCLSTIIKEDTTRQCMFAVIVAMLAPAVGVLQTTKFIWKLWDKLRNFLAGRMSTSISSAPPWVIMGHINGGLESIAEVPPGTMQKFYNKSDFYVYKKKHVLFICMGMNWLTLHFLQELMFWSQLRVLHLRWLRLCSILNTSLLSNTVVPLCTLGSTLKWFVQL